MADAPQVVPSAVASLWAATPRFVILLAAVLAPLTTGCFTSVEPLLPQSVATALASTAMRRLETPTLRVYYPASRRDEALRFTERVEACARTLLATAQIHNQITDRQMTVILPELTFNNGFTIPPILGYEPLAVVPTFNTIDMFSLEMGLPPDPAAVACHEITHYVHLQQIAGFAWLMNVIFGELYSPQLGLDAWFDEGLAVYYETVLQPGIGRLAWPFWHGAFAAGIAGRRLRGGDLSAFNRDFYLGNHYLVGSQFVRFLIERYGEQKLWKLIEVQGRSILFPLGVNVRFWQAYDKSLSTLIDEFADEMERRYPPVLRPAEQRTIAAVGINGRYGRAADGTEALLVSDHDAPPRLIVRDPGGRVLIDRNLIDVVPPRRLKIGAPGISGPPSFTADGRWLYFTALDLDATFDASRLVRVDLASGALTIAHDNLRGGGGSVSPDGRFYAFAQADGDRHDLAVVDLATGNIRVLAASAPGSYVSLPRYAQDGRRIVATVYDGGAFWIRVFDAETGAVKATITDGRIPVHDAAWADGDHVVYLGAERSDPGFQVYIGDLRTGQSRRLTHVPYLAFEPQVARGTLRFLNREGWAFTLDEVALGDLDGGQRPPVPPPSPPSPSQPPADADTSATDVGVSSVVPSPGEPFLPDLSCVAPPGRPAPGLAAGSPGSGSAAANPDPGLASVSPAQPSTPFPPAPRQPDQTGGSWVVPQPALAVLSDAPYSQTDHILVPQLRGPEVTTRGRNAFALGAILAGNDRLQFQRWMLFGVYQNNSARAGYGGGFGYANNQLAPFTIIATGLWLSLHDTPAPPPPVAGVPVPEPVPSDFTLDTRERQANLQIRRSFYENPVTLGFTLTEDDRPGDATVAFAPRRVVGPTLSASYTGVELTSYSGARRLFGVSTDFALYPAAWNTIASTLVDVRAEIDAVVPLPFSRRHTLFLDLYGRDLAGLPSGQRWLQVGGGMTGLYTRRSPDRRVPSDVEPDMLPAALRFVEPLRGYEDFPIATSKIAVGGATYTYPFIIDWGSASSLGLLPAFFLRQIDIQLFGRAAIDGDGFRHAAAGLSLDIRFALGPVPLTLRGQLARRFDDDRAYAQLVSLAAY